MARRVEAARGELLDSYRQALEAQGSPFTRDPIALRQAVVDGESILADLALSLGTDETGVNGERNIGADGGRDIHPEETLQAATTLFDTAIQEIARMVHAYPDSLHLLTRAARALNESLVAHVTEAADRHLGRLLNLVHAAHTKERRAIARELHDRIGHGVSVTSQQLELYDLDRHETPVRAAARIERAQALIEETLRDLRTLTSGLRFENLPEGLEKALFHLLETVRHEDVDLELSVNGDETWAPAHVRSEVFLILGEALRNALRHAGPAFVAIRVDVAPHELHATVDDDGCGFDVERVPAPGGIGLSTMAERAELLAGVLTVGRTPGGGTRVRLRVPLPGQSP
ncbi:sensor histidine kinase [Nonomuraea sp. B12E4]|uniref:sensor histidine kinase n=1 Tax=Nonomuraea sp. B12E4 TaxID=3153564 RepID=UPI00325DFF0E